MISRISLFAVGVLVALVLWRGSYGSAPQPDDTLKKMIENSGSQVGTADKKGGTKMDSKPGRKISRSAFDITPLSKSEVDELARKLKPDEAKVILNKGTEPAFCGNLLDNKKEGTYVCRLCALPLFSSEHKFNSGTGWPSYFRPIDLEHVSYLKDSSHGMQRIEILCTRCGGHLGHVFEDGPEPTGLRYCLNSISMEFVEKGQPLALKPVEMETAYFAGGCFWGVEDRFQQTTGVVDAVSGYMGGKLEKPTYKAVCYTETGHAETVKITFDPKTITYAQLLEKFFKYHDPTTLNRQGPDVGSQYRSAIFASTPEQAQQAKDFIAKLSEKPKYKSRPIVTQVVAADKGITFWPAEDYHQDYHERNGGHCAMPAQDDE
jgi:peptide methionine sulfoxide reductase msrA/msrB